MLRSELSDEQIRAVQAPEGLTCITAGAGTGKTTVLTFRIDWLIRECAVPAERILAMSFTKASAREIAHRAALLGSQQMVQAMTMHSFAARLLRNYTEAAGLADNFAIIDEDDEASVLAEVIAGWAEEVKLSGAAEDYDGVVETLSTPRKRGEGGGAKMAKRIRRMIGSWRENMITPNLALGRFDDIDADPLVRAGAHVFALLSERLMQNGALPMGELVGRAAALLEANPDIRNHVSAKLYHVMIDEFQDVNIAQVRLLEQIASAWRNLTVVGDDDQSLYMFRHAVPDAMRRAPDLLPTIAEKGVNRYTLTINRRSPDSLLRPANTLVEHNPRPGPKRLESGRAGAPPGFQRFPNEHAEARHIVRRIQDLMADGVPGSQIAVLSRSKMPIGGLAKAMLVAGIPHHVTTGAGFLERKVVRDMMAWARLAINPGCTIAFARAAGSPPRGLGEKWIQTIANAARLADGTVPAGIDYCIEHKLLKKSTAASAIAMRDLIESLHAEAMDPLVDLGGFIERICRETGYRDWALLRAADDAEQERIRTDLDDLGDIAAALQAEERVGSVLEFADELALAEDRNRSAGSEAVHVGTVHGAKGLEWDHVFLVAVENNVMPAPQNRAPIGPVMGEHDPWSMLGGCLEEERRLMHVALTRARRNVLMTMADRRAGSDRNEPSVFLREMRAMPRQTLYLDRQAQPARPQPMPAL